MKPKAFQSAVFGLLYMIIANTTTHNLIRIVFYCMSIFFIGYSIWLQSQRKTE